MVATQVAPYFDAVNFARRFWAPRGPAGLVDSTCPSTIAYPRMGHAIPPEYSTDRWKLIMEQAG